VRQSYIHLFALSESALLEGMATIGQVSLLHLIWKAMQPVEIVFLVIIAVSLAVSTYMIVSFFLDDRKQREEWESITSEKIMEDGSFAMESDKHARRDLGFERRRRMQLATPEPDLVLVQHGKFAAVILPLATEADTYEAIQCRLCMN
jgi:hypothetical protein